MIAELAYYQILGFPVIAYGGILTLLSLLTTLTFGILTKKGKLPNLGFKFHQIFATITIILALGHAILGIGSYI